MATVLLDSSSAIALALASDDRAVVTGDSRAFYRRHPDIDAAILAFTIYDDVCFDRPSIERNLEKLPALEQIISVAGDLYDRVAEDAIYKVIESEYVKRLLPDSTLAVKADQALGGELGISRYGPTSSWRHVERELSGTAANVAFLIGQKLHRDCTADVCAVLLRMLYYDALHRMIPGCDLVLHPLKASVYEPPADESTKVLGKTVLDNFDEDVRREFYERKARWFGQRDTRVEAPMLTEYVLRECTSWSDLPRVVKDVRESKQARRFRDGITELNEARLGDDNKTIDEILKALDAARHEWQKALPTGRLTTTITPSVSILALGFEKEFQVPDVKLNKSSADRILGFVQLLLQKS
jgi:hypothetical protein